MLNTTPPLVYLDSSDYSTMSDPSCAPDKVQTREELRHFAATNRVQFAFSGVHLSEMAPLQSSHSSAATARADLLVELCGRRAFVSFDRLLKLELSSLVGLKASSHEVLSTNAEWFPEFGEILSPFHWETTANEIDTTVKEQGMNRQQRRQLNRKLFKAKSPKSELRSWLAAQDPRANLDEILRLYPMRPKDAELLSGYVLGQVPASAAEAAFVESLRDPRWMMRWFAAHHDKMNAVADWLRAPARNMLTSMKETACAMQRLRTDIGDEAIVGKVMTIEKWRKSGDESLLRIAHRLLESFWPELNAEVTPDQVDRHCPGLSTAVRSLYSAVWDSFGESPRTPQESDFVDVVHSLYAPYVRFFRADRYMAPHIQRQVERHGTKVVSRLNSLPAEIQKATELASRSGA